mmetsp:Transcript_8859/g.19129  ORF Transcript_8859/g.19129 Transcript_8859/m.19129 type:complete len:268 (+) Transcript_8859:2706-3509(+)
MVQISPMSIAVDANPSSVSHESLQIRPRSAPHERPSGIPAHVMLTKRHLRRERAGKMLRRSGAVAQRARFALVMFAARSVRHAILTRALRRSRTDIPAQSRNGRLLPAVHDAALSALDADAITPHAAAARSLAIPFQLARLLPFHLASVAAFDPVVLLPIVVIDRWQARTMRSRDGGGAGRCQQGMVGIGKHDIGIGRTVHFGHSVIGVRTGRQHSQIGAFFLFGVPPQKFGIGRGEGGIFAVAGGGGGDGTPGVEGAGTAAVPSMR